MAEPAPASAPASPPFPGRDGREIESNPANSAAADPAQAGRLPVFPVSRLPADWTAWGRATAACAGARVDYAALGLFAAVAGIAGAGVRVQPHAGWQEPLVLWRCAVGGASYGKSSALGACRRLIEGLDDDDPDAPQRLVGEGTLRSLAAVVSRNPNGIVMWRDELMAWLPGRGARAARLKLRHFPVSVIGGTRPAARARALKGADDGMAACFLFAWPARPKWVPFAKRQPPDEEAALARLRQIAGCVGTPEAPLVLTLDKPALDLFEQVCRHWNKCAPDDESPYAEWLAQAGRQLARLAGVVKLLEWSEGREGLGTPSTIGLETLQQALVLWRWRGWCAGWRRAAPKSCRARTSAPAPWGAPWTRAAPTR